MTTIRQQACNRGCEIPLAKTLCGACGSEPAWLWPNGDCLCAVCFHEGEKADPKIVARDSSTILRTSAKRSKRQHPEADFQAQITDLLRLHDFKVAHFKKAKVPQKGGAWRWITPVAADGAGFPDVVAIHPSGKGIAWELKASRTGMKAIPAEQTTWLDLFHEAGFHAHVWIPSDWDEIVRILEAMELRISGRTE